MTEVVNLFISNISNNSFVAVLRSSKDKDFPDMWGLPGGKIEEEETIIKAAKREAQEELGVAVSLNPTPLYRSMVKTSKSVFSITVFAASTNDTVFIPHDKEIKKADYVTPKLFLDSLRDHQYPPAEIKSWSEFLLKKGFDLQK